MPSNARVSRNQRQPADTPVVRPGSRRITSKGQVTIPSVMRKRYNITMHTKLEFIPRHEGILVRPAREEGSFSKLGGSASEAWTIGEMLKRLDELRRENA